MLNKKEITAILVITLILAFVISLIQSTKLFIYSFISVLLIILINIAAKKVASYYLDSEIEIRLWEIKRYGFKTHSTFKKPFPAGAFFPIIFAAFSFGYLKWMASLVFDVKPKIYKAAKRHGLYSFSEMTEFQIGIIAATGILATLLFAVIGYIIGLPPEMNFVQLSIWFAFFNMIPFSDLDGNKIFFGNLPLWSLLSSIVLIALGYVLITTI